MRLRHQPNALSILAADHHFLANPTSMYGQWTKNKQTIHLEIGAGKGQFI